MRLLQNILFCASHVLFMITSHSGPVTGAVASAKPIVSSAVTEASSMPGTTARPSPSETSTPKEPITTDAAALERYYWYSNQTAKAWDLEFYDKIVFANETKPTKGRVADLQERQNGPSTLYGNWYPYNIASNTWGWFQVWSGANCNASYGNHWTYGHIVRTVVKEHYDGTPTEYFAWYNETSNLIPAGNTQGLCYWYYITSPQCTNKVWNPTSASWEPLTFMNQNYYYTSNNASYANRTVRTIFDCLLNRVAIQYYNIHPAFGYAAIQYKIEGMKYYRFIDANDFAWFVGCPSDWPGAWKRQGLGRNSNPVWDFSPPEQKDPATDRSAYPSNAGIVWNEAVRYTAMYWPWGDAQYVWVDGHKCIQMAASRPGLRHWTARVVDIPVNGYPQITAEYAYPSGWNGFTKKAYAINEPPFEWN